MLDLQKGVFRTCNLHSLKYGKNFRLVSYLNIKLWSFKVVHLDVHGRYLFENMVSIEHGIKMLYNPCIYTSIYMYSMQLDSYIIWMHEHACFLMSSQYKRVQNRYIIKTLCFIFESSFGSKHKFFAQHYLVWFLY